MTQLFTPAQQLAQAEALAKKAAEFRGQFDKSDDKTKADLRYAADSITTDRISVEIDGDWALTNGEYSMPADGGDFKVPADILVWVRSGGDWWIFQLEDEPLNHYGNPPDKMREPLLTPDLRFGEESSITVQADPPPAVPTAPATGAEGDAAPPGAGK
jgi:hypothetical protein